jgi:hypothetical protein
MTAFNIEQLASASVYPGGSPEVPMPQRSVLVAAVQLYNGGAGTTALVRNGLQVEVLSGGRWKQIADFTIPQLTPSDEHRIHLAVSCDDGRERLRFVANPALSGDLAILANVFAHLVI